MLTKILILPKKEEKNLFELIPLIEWIRSDFPDSKIHILHSIDLSFQLRGLFENLSYHTFEESNLGPVSSLKMAEKLKDVFNIDYSLVYRDDVGCLNLAKAIGGKVRIGNKSLVNDLFLTDSIRLGEGEKSSYMSLWGKYWKKTFGESKMSYVTEQKPENFFQAKEVEPFFFFPVSPKNEHSTLLRYITSLFEALGENRKILWLENENEDCDKLAHGQWENYVNASEAAPENLYHYLLHSRGVITNIDWVSSMASYLQIENILISDKASKWPNTSYFKLSPTILEISEEGLSFSIEGEKKPLDEGAFIEEIFQWFKI